MISYHGELGLSKLADQENILKFILVRVTIRDWLSIAMQQVTSKLIILKQYIFIILHRFYESGMYCGLDVLIYKWLGSETLA